jgi:hypothetical protein
LNPFEEQGIHLGEKFIREDVQAAERDLGIAQELGGYKGKKADQGDGAEQSEVRDDDGRTAALVFSKPLECGLEDVEDGKFHPFL